MVTIKEKQYLRHALRTSERSIIVAELMVDEASELPTVDGLRGLELAQGSIAYVIRSGEMYVMDSEGTWYKSGGEG